ncbi:uncharacterized protein LOC118502655 [Anopheles stephensi]|uniref:uncharacterized protein LOC118502655 n=1 Tax=Anopheles stephensi TaxID=30069 RepID=UPI001658A468|nr:uncharacterized protein LOC118502655 [Anopheles stephensi]
MSDKKLSIINQLRGKNPQLKALRKSGVLYRKSQRLWPKPEKAESIPYEAQLRDVNVPTTSEPSTFLDLEFLNEATPCYTEETLFLETQDYELNLNELEEEADEEESADEDNDGAYLDDKDDPDIDQMNES